MEEKYNNILNSRLIQNKSYIEKELKKILSDIVAPKLLKEVMLYAVLNGGKRIRPFIISEVSSLYQVKSTIYKYPSIAIEMAHCFSLIYDDLPCMDDDDLRRGNPSVHVKFDEANALLGGASLLTYAYNILASKNFSIEDKKKIALINIFSNAIGHKGMLAGQFLDLEAEKLSKKPTIKKFNNIQEKKTSLLLAFCTRTAGILGGANTKEQEDLYEIGLLIGRIFQTKDDILDLEGTEKEMGKRVNKDQAKNKATIIRLKDINYAKTQLKNLCFKTKERLKGINKNTTTLIELIDFLNYRKN